jgi:hypothetical protein
MCHIWLTMTTWLHNPNVPIIYATIINLPNFVGLYNIFAKFGLHRFIQKSHEFHVVLNLVQYFYLFNILNIQMDETNFLSDIHEMFMLKIGKSHSFLQNYILIIVWV